MRSYHFCFAHNCDSEICLHKCFCVTHWRMLDKDMQARVYAAWNHYRAAIKPGGPHLGEATTKLREVQHEAIESIAWRTGPKRTAVQP